MIAKVALVSGRYNFEEFFDYEVPAQMQGVAKVGVRVSVPFGKSNKLVDAIIVEICGQSQFDRLKEINKIVSTQPLCSEYTLNLCKWMQKKYFCCFTQALRLMLPSFDVRAKFVQYVSLTIALPNALDLCAKLSKRAPVQAKAVELLSRNGIMLMSDLLLANISRIAIKSLEKHNIVKITNHTVNRDTYKKTDYVSTKFHSPNVEQKQAIDYLNNKISQNIHEISLLYGVTGSGKTEVFMWTIRHCISLGKRAIVMVPEISLTPQLIERFVSRFGTRIAVIHSALSAGERFDAWHMIHSGQADIIIGARSAIFAPLKDIGIIILDEEHDDSYKSDITPKYHAKEVAIKRAKDENALLLLASATPSLLSFYRANAGIYTLLKLTQRSENSKMPDVSVVDMRSELINNGNSHCLSLRLQDEIATNLSKKEKIILFLNRRGYSTFVSCRKCGYVVTCDHCTISMTYNKVNENLVCRYCGSVKQNVKTCPNCNSNYIKYFGCGTQKAQEQVQILFPECRILRMDGDVTVKKNAHRDILRAFSRGEADILLGTQMVTKGLDFRDVTLVGVLAADTALNMDDFRATERTFTLLTQVCGRTGRGVPGRAIIQTYQPKNYAIELAQLHDYDEFYNQEIQMRRKLQYPPFTDLISIMVSSENDKEAAMGSVQIKEEISQRSEVLGPTQILKIKNMYRQRLIIKLKPNQHSLISEINNAILPFKQNKNIKIDFDVNPSNLS